MRSDYRPTKSSSIGSATCSSAQSDDHRTRCIVPCQFTYQAGSCGELYPRVGFIVTNLSRPADRVVAFYNKRGTCEQWIKEGKGAIKWTRLLCRTFAANAVRLQLHALAYNLGNFLRTLATPEPIKDWSLTSLKEKREGGEPRTLCRLPDGGGRHPTTNVPGDSAAARAAGSHSHLASVLLPGRKSANIHASSGGIRGIPKQWPIRNAPIIKFDTAILRQVQGSTLEARKRTVHTRASA
jgi:hypothetical protein